MKYLLTPVFLLLVAVPQILLGMILSGDQNTKDSQLKLQNPLQIFSSPETSPLAIEWIREYKKLKPGVEIKSGEINPLNLIPEQNNLYLLSESAVRMVKDTLWKIEIGRDAIVPVMNAKNPLLEKILIQGISSKKFHQLFTGNQMSGGPIDGTNEPPHLYMSENEAILQKIATFSQTNYEDLKKRFTIEKGSILPSIRSDLHAIGFCKLSEVTDSSGNQFAEGVRLLPIDKNGNNRIDYFENFYSSPEAFTRGIWIGKYPAQLCGVVYAVSSTKPSSRLSLDFLAWIQEGGQYVLNSRGYGALASSERTSNIVNLSEARDLSENPSSTGKWIYFLAGAVIALFVWFFWSIQNRKKTILSIGNPDIAPSFKTYAPSAPKGIYFDKSHTWAFMEKEGVVKIGIDDFLQHLTGELTHISMKDPGEEIRKGERIFTISHNGKKLDIHAPVSGIIREKNRNLMFDSTLLNSSPYQDGWVYVIEPKNWLKETRFMFMGENYRDWMENELIRLKDFFAAALKTRQPEFSTIILQDGGEIRDQVLSDLDPEIWEDFQSKFIDSSR